MESSSENNYFHLEPFIHQVGGHSSMLCLDQATVCKPLVPRELQFYETVPDSVRKFTPKFYGVVKVRVVQEEGGYVTLIATPPACYKPIQSNDKRCDVYCRFVSHYQINNISFSNSVTAVGTYRECLLTGTLEVELACRTYCYPVCGHETFNSVKSVRQHSCSRIRMRRSGSIEVDSSVKALFHEDQPEARTSENMGIKKETALNPWVLKCHRTQLQELMAHMYADSSEPNFILLENLTSKFTFPCILDLKMGTRQYGDAASLPKKQSKMFKVVSTTSGKLGVRIGGMQVYQVTSKHFLCRNKFYGRSLTVGGFQQALRQFLHNGVQLRSDVLPPLIQRLEELVYVLGRQDTVRFYTTSLLLLYEGDDCHSGTSSTNFDFDKVQAKSLEKGTQISLVHDHDTDCARNDFSGGRLSRRSSSAETLSVLLDQSLDDVLATSEDPNKSSVGSHHRRTSSTATYEDIKVKSSPSFEATIPSPLLPMTEPLVDVRIIDFAHSTHKGLDDPVIYSGPDHGFLFGLENMIAILKGIERDHG